MKKQAFALAARILSVAVFVALPGCGSSSGSKVDALLGGLTNAPILTAVSSQIVAQETLLSVDINNIKGGSPGNDDGMTYSCMYDTADDVSVTNGQPCANIPLSTVTFSASTGLLQWTPHAPLLGNYMVKVTGSNSAGSASTIFSVGVRLNFSGITSLTNISGTGATVGWNVNTAAVAYQVFQFSNLTGQYTLLQTVQGSSTASYTVSGLTSNTGYTLRVEAVDALGNLDGNTVSKSFTTTSLTKFSLSPASITLAAGTPQTITVQALNSDGVAETVGGLTLTPQILSGTALGTFGAVSDNGNGTYSFLFTPTTVGTPISIGVSISSSYLVLTSSQVTVIPGPASATTSTLAVSASPVVSGSAVTFTATLMDAYSNPIPSGATVAFSATGGTSTGTIGTVTNGGGGVYTAQYTGVTAGTAQTVQVLFNGTALALSGSIQVIPGTPTATNSTISVSSATVSSGQSVTVTASLNDLNNNPVPSGILVSFNKSGGTSAGYFGTVTNAGAGLYSTTFTGTLSGTPQTLTVSVNGVALTISTTVTVLPGAVSSANSTLTISSGVVASGNYVTATATLRDGSDNLIPSGVAVTFSATGGTSTGTLSAVTNQGNGVYTVRYTGVVAGTAQAFDVLVNGVDLGLTQAIQVVPGLPDATQSTLTVSSASVISNNSVTVTETVKDANGNPLSSGIVVGVSATGGTSTGVLSAVTNAGNGVYTATYTGVTAGSAQTLKLLIGGSILGPSTNITVVAGAFSLSQSSLTTTNTTVTSGTPVTLTATLLDVNNNPISALSTVAFTKTGGTSTGNFGSVINQGGGVYTVTYTGVVAGTAQNIGVTVNGVATGLGTTEIVVPNAPYASTSSITVSSGTVVSGNTVSITATIYDLNSNPISSGITVGFQANGGTSTGTLAAVTNVGGGVYTSTYTGVTAGTAQNLSVLVNGTALGPVTTITVIAGSLYSTNSSLTTTNASDTSGTSVTLTATLLDQNSNPVSGTVAFTKTGGTSTGNFGSVVSQGGGVYTVTYSGVLAGTAQTIGVTINGVDSGLSLAETVVPAAPSIANSTITVGTPSLVSGTSTTVTATLKDLNNNTISSGVAVTITAIGGSSTGTLGGITNVGNGVYTTTYLGLTAGSAQTLNINVNGSVLGPTATVTVVAGALNLTNSSLVTTSTSLVSGTFATVTATLRDLNNNPVPGTVAFTKAGGTSTGNFSAFVNQGSGIYTTTYTAVVAGSAQTIGVTLNGVDSGMSVSETVSPGAPSSALSTLTVSSGTVVSGNSVTITATIVDSNGNPISSGIVVGLVANGGTSTGSIGSVTNAGSGVYTATYTGIVAGSAQTLGITVGGTALGPSSSVTVTPAGLNGPNSSLVTSNATPVSGGTVTITATLRDLNNNAVAGAVAFTKTGGSSTGNFGSVVSQGAGVYTITYTAVVAGTAQTIGVTIAGVSTGMTITETVSPGAPSPITSSINVATSTVASGSSDVVTATILDSNSNPINSGITVTFSKNGGSSTGTFSAVTPMGNGQYAVNYQGLVAGTAQTIGILIGGIALGPTTTVSVTPGTPSNALSTLTVSSATVVSAQTVTLTATIVDSNSNPVSSGILVTFGASGGTSTGSISAVTNQGNGVYTATYTGLIAGTAQTVQAYVNAAAFGPTQSLQVLVGAPSSTTSTLTVVSSPLASGGTATISALIRDANSNPITSQYTIAFQATGGTSSGNFGSVTNSGGGNFSVIYTGLIAGTPLTVSVLANSSPISGLSSSLQVVPGAASSLNSTFTIGSPSVQSGTSTGLTIILRDSNNNLISTGATITFNRSSGGSNGTISAVTNNGNGNYTATYTGITQGAAQTITLVVNGVTTTMSVSATVTAGPPSQMSISGPANPLNSIDCNGPYTVTLLDASSNVTSVTSGSVSIALSTSVAGSLTGTLFSDGACSNGITSLGMAAYVSTAQFYYKSYTPYSFTLTFTPTPNSIAVNSTTITNVAVISWIGSAVTATMTGSGPTSVADDSTGGLINPMDNFLDGNYLYVVDNGSYRILKYNTTTNTLVGWIGHVGLSENMAAYDGSGSCTGLSAGTLTPIWCTGGRSNPTNSSILNSPRYISVDSNYLYVSTGGNNRILRFLKTTGAYQGWIGRIGSTSGMTTPACTTAGVGAAAPTWCMGGSAQTGTLDGHLNNPQGVLVSGGVLYVADYGNQRVQSFNASTGLAAGWVGNVLVAPSATGQLATCSSIPASGAATPGWCLSAGTGTAQTANRNNLATLPSEVVAPNEGFYNPVSLTSDGTYLYVGDGSNARVVRLNLATGAFSGWIGNLAWPRYLAGNIPSPLGGTANYTSNWTTGGQSYGLSTPYGFCTPRGLANDGTYLYVSDDCHRISRVNLSNGQGFVWLGRTTTSPTGGYTGCSSTPVGGATPGWCLGGNANRAGNSNSDFYNPYGITIGNSQLYVADVNNFRVQYFTLSTGVFAGWIGGTATTATTWTRTLPGTETSARWGIDDYSVADVSTAYNGLALFNGTLFETDFNGARIKQFNALNGLDGGYVGTIGTYAPTGPAACVGYTSGMTPAWCTGGGRLYGGNGIQQFSGPLSVASDGTYAYVADNYNNRVARVQISTSLYLGWIGDVSSTPTDGSTASCLTTGAGTAAPGWCIGGSAQSGLSMGMFNAPRALYYDSGSGYLLAVDNSGRLMQINTSTGAFAGVAATVSAAGATGCTVTSSVASGWCTSATGTGATNNYGGLNNGSAIATNSTYIFVVDSANHRVNRYTKSTGAPAGVIALMSNGTGLNTTGTGGACNGLAGFPVATPGWCYGTALGSGISTTNGTGNNQFNGPRGVWADDNGLYVADSGNNRIVSINPNTGAFLGWKGLIATTTGMTPASCVTAGAGAITPTWCLGGTANPGKLLGEFNYPTGITGDANYIYVVDSYNNRIVTLPR